MIDSSYCEGGRVGCPKFDPRQLRYDQHGVPVLSTREIESAATQLLEEHCPRILKSPRMTPILEILAKLEASTGLSTAFVELGHKGSFKVVGRVSFRGRRLYLDISLTNEREAAFRFTAAH